MPADPEDIPTCGPDPECAGETCGTFTGCNLPQPEGGCVTPVCVTTTEGLGFCVEGATECEPLIECVTSADCAEGEVCAVDTCCVRNVCIPEEAFCPPPVVIEATAPEAATPEAAAPKAAAPEGGPTIGSP
ncbi:MAG: hypothetical protein KJP23_00270 [Deltaproteobacteria bacterium]|nr:hypothetical protein [Deltaproteobacteria bacterium]